MMRILLAAAAFLMAGSAAAAENIVIRHVTIIDPATGARSPQSTVVVQADRIAAVGPADTPVPRGAKLIEARGKFLIPGLWDAHVHLFNLTPPAFQLLVANGITSVRDMGGDAAELKSWNRQIAEGALIGPRIRYCGPMLEGPEGTKGLNHLLIASPEEAEAAVNRLADQGVDCIKVRSYKDKDTFVRLVAAAKATNLPVFVHPLPNIEPEEAAALGVGTVEHAFFPYPFTSLSTERKAAIITGFRDHGVRVDPTLVAWAPSKENPAALKALFGTLGPETAPDRFISPSLYGNWAEGVGFMGDRGSPGWIRAIDAAAADTAQMYRGGVPILIGTDLGAPFVRPDTSLYEELESAVTNMGLSPAEALKAAIVEPARLFHLENNLGAIAPGKLADMVLLDADPLLEISNVRKVDTVIANGVVYGPAARERLKKDAIAGLKREWAEHPPQPTPKP